MGLHLFPFIYFSSNIFFGKLHINKHILSLLLGARKRLYNLLFLLVCRLVGPSVRPSVHPSPYHLENFFLSHLWMD
jgi:hypothetical protein